jgi:hypothetical protein
MKPPFEIYRDTDIADADGHVCTAENPQIAQAIVAALSERGAVLQAHRAAEALGYTRGKIEGYAEGITDAAEQFAELETKITPLIVQLTVMLTMTRRVGEWVKRARTKERPE